MASALRILDERQLPRRKRAGWRVRSEFLTKVNFRFRGEKGQDGERAQNF
jgi:hypothetical protein